MENERYFYSSYEEKLENLSPEIYGLYYRDSLITEENIRQIRTFHIASNREAGLEYLVRVNTDQGEEFIVQDFNTNKVFTRPMEEHGVCTVEARMAGDFMPFQTMEINY